MEQVIANAMAATDLRAPTVTDTGGVEEWMRLYRGRVFRYILFATRDEDVAESLTQDCFLRAHGARTSFRGECAMSTWLMRIAVNLVRDQQRSMKLRFWKRAAMLDASEMSDRLPDSGSSSEHRLIAQERVASVWRAVETLSERQRSIFLLRFVEELELPEIAEAMRMNVNTVKSHLYRALSVVKQQVGEGR
ncbi:MAG TPA: RNA polymerase sigma factor [Acidobacteriaceae bacterium]|nr:RNA polymerase sigma factor [Acidobacteriaceae bacterium]